MVMEQLLLNLSVIKCLHKKKLKVRIFNQIYVLKLDQIIYQMYTQNWYSTVAMRQMEEDRIRKVTAYLTLNYLAFQSFDFERT